MQNRCRPARVLCTLSLAVALTLSGPRAACAADDASVARRPSAGCKAPEIQHGRRLQRAIEVDGSQRSDILDVPDQVKASVPVPLLLDFHGFGHSGAGVWNVSAFRALAEREGFITAYPDGLPVKLRLQGEEYERPGWEIGSLDSNRDLRLVSRLLDQLEQTYCVDLRRVYATGFSNGAFFSSMLGCVMPDRFAAVAPVSGGPLSVPCAPARGVPILIQHGSKDDVVPVELAHQARDAWIAVDACAESATEGTCEVHTECRNGAVVEYCEEAYPHAWPPSATARIWEFFRAHPMP